MQDKILDLLDKYGSLSFSALKNFLACTDEELSRSIAPLENNKIIKLGKNYELLSANNLEAGTIVFRNDKIFVQLANERLLMQASDWNKLYPQDKVIISFIDELGYKVGKLVRLIAHSNLPIICRMTRKKRDNHYLFALNDPTALIEGIWVSAADLKSAKYDDICEVNIKYGKNNKTVFGVVNKIIANRKDIGSDVLALVAQSGVSYQFDELITEELLSIDDSVKESDLAGRVDFTNDQVITIDGVDSKDFDDAVCCKRLANGNYYLGVHIADVSSYVKACSQLDLEALKRGTSIYLVDRVIPMLPEKLSNGICSLNEGVVRLVLSCQMEFNSEGDIVDSSIVSGYIKSLHRMTYDDVNKMLVNKEKKLIKKYSDIYPMLELMLELSEIIRQKREKQGALDFDAKEMKIVVNSQGEAVDVLARVRDKAEMLIEDFMLSANQVVAETLNHLEYPCCYRVHEEPNKEKLAELNPLLTSLGLKLRNINNGVSPQKLQKILTKIKGSNEEVAISSMLLRAMAKARYDASCLGHYGLAMPFYCHFTSPIRRYPDLFTHRIINDLIIHPKDFAKSLNELESKVDEVCLLSSNNERKAIDLEREVDDMKAAEHMAKFKGECFDGIISSVTSFGFFVMLDNTIEGLVHIRNLPDYFNYDAKNAKLIGTYSKEEYNIGDRVKVRVLEASKEARKIDFMVVNHFKRKGGQ